MTTSLVLEYGPGVSQVRIDDGEVFQTFYESFRFRNPDWDGSKAMLADAEGYSYDVPEWITFVLGSHEEGWYVPTGLYFAIERWCDEYHVKLVPTGGWVEAVPWFKAYHGPLHPEVTDDIVPGITLRGYQVDAVNTVLQRRRGVLEIATGGGKTEIGIATILALGTPLTIWLVPDIKAGETALKRLHARGVDAGLLGGGKRQLSSSVVVAVVNSAFNGIRKRDEDVRSLFANCECFIIDECHHQATAATWKVVASQIQAEYRIGLSGTPFKDNQIRTDPAHLDPYDSWLVGYTGPSLVHLSPKHLIANDSLTRGIFVSFRASPPEDVKGFRREDQWTEVYKRGIAENGPRNAQVAQLVSNLAKMGRKPLVSVEKLEHGRDIQRLLLQEHRTPAACSYGSGVTYLPREVAEAAGVAFIPAPIYTWCRRKQNGKFKRVKEQIGEDSDIALIEDDIDVDTLLLDGTIGAIVGSKIFDEAVDIPWITDLVNAAGGKASQRLRQKIGRILRKFDGKNAAWFWDPWDDCHHYLLSHSKKRWKIALEEGYPAINDWNWTGLMTSFDLSKKIGTVVMKPKEIAVTISMSLPVPGRDYTTIRPSVHLSADLEEGDDPHLCADQLHAQALSMFLSEAAKQIDWAGYTAQVGPHEALRQHLAQLQAKQETPS